MKGAAPKQSESPAAAPLAALVDELGALEKELAPYAIKQARVEQLRTLIRAHYSAVDPAQSFEITGSKFAAILGPRGTQRVVDHAKLWKLAPVSLLKGIATVTLKALEAAVSPDIVARVVETKAIGPRTLRVVERTT